ncbi:MAG TPA: hypothetical protein PKE00_16700, partial [Planctomycetota bacterium]|nr:hypothetical protein [Planctomycetota bacterium]
MNVAHSKRPLAALAVLALLAILWFAFGQTTERGALTVDTESALRSKSSDAAIEVENPVARDAGAQRVETPNDG